MFSNIENLTITLIHKNTTANLKNTITDRPKNSFILRTENNSRYTFSDRVIDLHPGEMVFLPKGSTYLFECVDNKPCRYVSVNFLADITGNEPFKFSFDGFARSDEFQNTLPDLWKFGGQYEHFLCYSIFYELLAYVQSIQNQTYLDKNKLNLINPALTYLKKHIYDCDLKTELLPDLCGISGTYFRKIFKSNFSTSPQEYILAKRLSHAKAIFDSGDFNSVSEVALSAGYNDALYFSRAFKKKYGVCPSAYVKQ